MASSLTNHIIAVPLAGVCLFLGEGGAFRRIEKFSKKNSATGGEKDGAGCPLAEGKFPHTATLPNACLKKKCSKKKSLRP